MLIFIIILVYLVTGVVCFIAELQKDEVYANFIYGYYFVFGAMWAIFWPIGVISAWFNDKYNDL